MRGYLGAQGARACFLGTPIPSVHGTVIWGPRGHGAHGVDHRKAGGFYRRHAFGGGRVGGTLAINHFIGISGRVFCPRGGRRSWKANFISRQGNGEKLHCGPGPKTAWDKHDKKARRGLYPGPFSSGGREGRDTGKPCGLWFPAPHWHSECHWRGFSFFFLAGESRRMFLFGRGAHGAPHNR